MMTPETIVAPTLAAEITAAHLAAIGAARTAIEHARRCGELLTQAKAAVPHGQWLPWLAEHCPDIGARQAQKYMRLAGGWPAIEAAANTNPESYLTIDGALQLLAAPEQAALTRHPAASWVPPMTDDERTGLRASIRTQGVLVPIALCDGMVLDGWERYLACRDLVLDCPTVEWNAGGHYHGTPADFVQSANLIRQHQRDAAADEADRVELDHLQARVGSTDVTVVELVAIMRRCETIAAAATERQLRATRILGEMLEAAR
jgi:hypothetical protein